MECKYQEYDGRLKELFINGLNNETTITKMIKELTALKYKIDVSSEEVLIWAQTVEVQRAQKAVFDSIKELQMTLT